MAFAVLVALVALVVALLLWSGGERPSWGDNADDDAPERRRRADDDHSGPDHDD